jgi:hypothetical protein
MTAMVETKPAPREYRCYCGWLLFKGRLIAGSTVQVRCRGCREIVTIVATDD